MPNLTEGDGTPAWVKGDLPPDASESEAIQPEAPAKREDGAVAAPPEVGPETLATLSEHDQVEASATDESGSEIDPGAGPAPSGELETDLAAEKSPEGSPGEAEISDAMPSEAGSTGAPLSRIAEMTGHDASMVVQPLADDIEGDNAAASGTDQPAAKLPDVDPLDLEALVEGLLFVADGAVTVGQLAEALEVQAREVESALSSLANSYQRRGLSLQRFRDKVQLTTSPGAAAAVERFLGLAAATPLSRAALESLAIIAYQQPVTRPQIDAVRGVNSDSVIKNLLSKGLIEETGRAEGPGRPVLYATTPEFMQHFGLSSLTELPPLALSAGAPATTDQDAILKG